MKDDADKKTVDFIGEVVPKRRPGRPPNPDGLSKKELQAQWVKAKRAALKAADSPKRALYVELPGEVLDGLDKYLQFRDETKAACIERLIRTQLLRKR